MSRPNLWLAIVAVISSSEAVASAQSFLCIGVHATGFTYNKQSKRWAQSAFNTRKYIVKTPVTGPNIPSGANESVMVVYEFGEPDERPLEFCRDNFNSAGFLFCEGLGDTFNFNRETLKFIRTFPRDYIEPADISPFADATPFMEIGSCSAL